ncbi:hypothetical protein QJS10_CPB15g00853 [Acorus calamus]|uniref:Uncharacterized protein n=1 Tax=Acorus calamus TaxID=4465 RepID=A0AAV9D5L0_ACOCL|nr:hypothetical protein QJS10_CPB15g00853 [Acorus calamus]
MGGHASFKLTQQIDHHILNRSENPEETSDQIFDPRKGGMRDDFSYHLLSRQFKRTGEGASVEVKICARTRVKTGRTWVI